VLCTISMLSNPMLAQANVFAVVPVDILIIDEASQINVSDYIVRALSNHSTSYYLNDLPSISSTSLRSTRV
jgi:hypothetical protein